MTTKQMNDLVDRYLDSNGLSNPSIRKRAARKVLGYMDTAGTSTGPETGNPTRMPPRGRRNSLRRASMQTLWMMPFKMETTMTCWTRTSVRKGSDNIHA